jgi:hypothetical protein
MAANNGLLANNIFTFSCFFNFFVKHNFFSERKLWEIPESLIIKLLAAKKVTANN